MIKKLEYTKQVMHKATSHQTLTNAQTGPEQWTLASLPPAFLIAQHMPCVMEYPFGLLGLAVLAVSPHTFLCPSSLLTGRT